MKELIAIQSELKAPKNQYNNFGRYNYRSAEDILEAVKPLLKKHKCTLVITDEMVEVGGRVYVKAVATITNESGEQRFANGFAREEESKKGMDSMQLTGATSSYARKYAMNGLLAIDDAKDSDTTNTHGKSIPGVTNQKIIGNSQPDSREWITKPQLDSTIKKIKEGETEWYDKAIKRFKMKREYREELDKAMNKKAQ